MKRKYIAEKFTDQELLNLKEGKCWCGKEKKDFQNGMLKYCSPKHRQVWYSKTITWSEFRNEYLSKHGPRCDQCGVESERITIEKAEQKRDKFLLELARDEEIRKLYVAREISKLNQWFEDRLLKIFESEPSTWDVEKIARKMKIDIPAVPKGSWKEEVEFQVDHIVAISNGGDEFNEDNLQVLCVNCHKEKTKSDMKEYRVKTETTL